jgi:transcriptional regulator with GAF, ATPase, and Fis domain
MSYPEDRDTPTVPTDRFAALAAIRRDAVTALRVHGSGRDIELPPDRSRLLVGASSTCDVVLEDEYVSACHCQLERRDPDRLIVRDRQSKNGCFINGNRIEVAELRPGSVLTVGGVGLLALGLRTRTRPSAREALVGRAPAFRLALDRALVAAASSCNVLLVGETGTGKELFARAIHEASSRALGPFMAVNCGGIPAELVESELFGHEKGAFTGATSERDGVFAQADGGTLFLDELGELPPGQQPHLLRALETRLIRRVGGSRERAVDIRLVAATNRLDLDRTGSPLRADLFHRVATLVVELPPLRMRLDDIPILVESFMAELEPEFGRRAIQRDALAALAQHPWPGNVRELRHAVHRASALSRSELRVEDLLPRRSTMPYLERRPLGPRPPAAADAPGPPGPHGPHGPHGPAPGATVNLVDATLRDLLRDAYRRHGSVRRAAAALGLPKSTFADRARKLGVL